jgi:hypothetical protein
LVRTCAQYGRVQVLQELVRGFRELRDDAMAGDVFALLDGMIDREADLLSGEAEIEVGFGPLTH